MVTFRCEYSWLLFCWPMACLLWLFIASLSLFLMSEDIKITLDGSHRSFWQILALPYRLNPTQSPQYDLPKSLPASPLPSGLTEVPRLSKTNSGSIGQEIEVNEGKLNPQSRWASSEYQMTRDVYEGQEQPRPRRTVLSDITVQDSPPPTASKFREDLTMYPPTPRTAVGISEKSFTVAITMKKEAFWQWYEAGIETVGEI